MYVVPKLKIIVNLYISACTTILRITNRKIVSNHDTTEKNVNRKHKFIVKDYNFGLLDYLHMNMALKLFVT